MEKKFPGIIPCFTLAPNVSPCTVALDQWGDASVGGFYNVEVVVGGGGGLVALVSGISPFLVRE